MARDSKKRKKSKQHQKTHRSRETFSILEQTSKQKQFDFAEVFRHIRTNIEYSTMDTELKSICVVSTQSGEAKSTCAMNLAYIFAAKYERVLLVDCDLRKRMVHRYMNLPNDEGLSDALREYTKTHAINPKYFQRITHESFSGYLSVLTAGTKVPNPSEMLSSQTFANFMRDLKDDYDFIIVDCPPAMQTSDPIPVGNAVDGALFVVSAQDTKRNDAAAAVKLLQRNQVNVIGSVLTKAEAEGSSYYYYYY